MGYTHYWRKEKKLDEVKWAGFVADVKEVYEQAGDAIAFEYDQLLRPPHADERFVRFNGVEEAGHETFYFERLMVPAKWQTPDEQGRWFAFCKTAEKPYDDYVVQVLKLAKQHFGDAIELSSDGGDEVFA